MTGLEFRLILWDAITMITRQSVVFYSKLHQVLNNRKVLRSVLWMIIFNGVLWHTLTTVVNYGVSSSNAAKALHRCVCGWLDRCRYPAFACRNSSSLKRISGIYLSETARSLKVVSNGNTRSLMWQLFVINATINLIDVGLLALEYKD